MAGPKTKQTALVTGGSGFLGRRIVDLLLESEKYNVVVFDIAPINDPRVKCIVGDLRDPNQVSTALEGVDVVFHVATAAPTGTNTLNKQLMWDVNVKGTQNVVDACVAQKVPRLLYTSSSSVVFQGKSHYYINEDAPYAKHPMDFYTQTKAEGEKVILAANSKGGLATVALRPSAIFGEGDKLIVPTTVAKCKEGKMKYVIGNGKNEMDWTYVGNVALGHLQAAEHLSLDSPLAGKPYFLTNDDPMPSFTFLGHILHGLGYPRPSKKLPATLLFVLAFIFVWFISPIFKLFGKEVSTEFTPNRIKLVSVNRTFSIERAKRDFGYKPKVGMQEAISRTVTAFPHLHAEKAQSDKKAM